MRNGIIISNYLKKSSPFWGNPGFLSQSTQLYRMRPKIKGLSHGLNKCPPDTCQSGKEPFCRGDHWSPAGYRSSDMFLLFEKWRTLP